MRTFQYFLSVIVLLIAAYGCQAVGYAEVPAVSGHRGANAIAPENTLASADSCIKYGVGNMECDVCISKDSVFYLLHDSTLDRTTNGTGLIRDRLSADIDTLDAGSWFGPEFAGQRVPRFADLLRKARQSGMSLTVDFRDGDMRKLLELIKEEGMLENCNFSFYDEDDVKRFRAIAPEVKTLQAYVRSIGQLERVVGELKPDIAVVHIDSLTPEFVRRCRAHNLQVVALVLGLDDKTEENRKAVELGVDVVATDRPEAFVMKYGRGRARKQPVSFVPSADRRRPASFLPFLSSQARTAGR